MRLFEIVDSDAQLLDTLTSILVRAKAEGVEHIDMKQLINDLGDPSLTPELVTSIITGHTGELKDLVANATLDQIDINTGVTKKVQQQTDRDTNRMKATATKQALASLDSLS
jgi:hypothetical protein